jgi:hypothetical protein
MNAEDILNSDDEITLLTANREMRVAGEAVGYYGDKHEQVSETCICSRRLRTERCGPWAKLSVTTEIKMTKFWKRAFAPVV